MREEECVGKEKSQATQMTLGEWVVLVAGALMRLQDSVNGAMPAGHNGPYHDPETPVRNTANSLRAFILAWRVDDKCEFYGAAKACADYLTGASAPKDGAVWIHRARAGKDAVNGLIGSAWVLGALTDAARFLEDTEAIQQACDLICEHEFDQKEALWLTANPEAQKDKNEIDWTLNHQLWFAAEVVRFCRYVRETSQMVSAMIDCGTILSEVEMFLEKLPNRICLDTDGCIRQAMWGGGSSAVRRGLRYCIRPGRLIYERQRAAAYHAFNLHAFARLRMHFPNHVVWQDAVFVRAHSFINSKRFHDAIRLCPFGMGYNPVGFEMATYYGLNSSNGADLSDSNARICDVVKMQLSHTWDPEKCLLASNTDDPVTLSCRVAELADAPELILHTPVEVPLS